MLYANALSEKDAQELDQLYTLIQTKTTTVLGYPVAMDFDYTELYRFNYCLPIFQWNYKMFLACR